jgi:hypothetical protein
MPSHGVFQRGQMTALAIVQGERLGLVHQGPRALDQHRIVCAGQHPCLADMRHRETGRGLARGLEQPDRVAVGQREGADGLVEQFGGLGRRARHVVPLRVSRHGVLSCV